jgi:hypothetical protein
MKKRYKCQNNTGYKDFLTKGKIYDILVSDSVSFVVFSDTGTKIFVDRSRFNESINYTE